MNWEQAPKRRLEQRLEDIEKHLDNVFDKITHIRTQVKYNYRLTFAVAAALGLLVMVALAITLVILVHPAFVFGIILLGFMIIPVVIFPDPLYSCTCQKCRGMR